MVAKPSVLQRKGTNARAAYYKLKFFANNSDDYIRPMASTFDFCGRPESFQVFIGLENIGKNELCGIEIEFTECKRSDGLFIPAFPRMIELENNYFDLGAGRRALIKIADVVDNGSGLYEIQFPGFGSRQRLPIQTYKVMFTAIVKENRTTAKRFKIYFKQGAKPTIEEIISS